MPYLAFNFVQFLNDTAFEILKENVIKESSHEH